MCDPTSFQESMGKGIEWWKDLPKIVDYGLFILRQPQKVRVVFSLPQRVGVVNSQPQKAGVVKAQSQKVRVVTTQPWKAGVVSTFLHFLLGGRGVATSTPS
jgi:hypothetical protein